MFVSRKIHFHLTQTRLLYTMLDCKSRRIRNPTNYELERAWQKLKTNCKTERRESRGINLPVVGFSPYTKAKRYGWGGEEESNLAVTTGGAWEGRSRESL